MLRRCSFLCAASTKSITESVVTRTADTRSKKSFALQKKQYRALLKSESFRRVVKSRRRLIHEKTEAMKQQLTLTTNARDVLVAQLADQIFSRGHEYHSAATNITFVPDGNPATPEIALVGRAKCGKSSLLRSLFRGSRAVGRGNSIQRRDAVNFYSVGGGVFNIADTPGFGGTSVPWSTVLQSAILVRNFVRCRPNLKMMYYCMDINHNHGVYIQDLDLLKFFASEVPNFTIVLTKGDRLPHVAQHAAGGRAKETHKFSPLDVRKELLRNDIEHPVLVTSAFEMGGIDALRYDMVMQVVHSLPSEALSLTEARKLSNRVFSQDELASVRKYFIPPTDVDEDVYRWNIDVKREQQAAHIAAIASSNNEGEGPKLLEPPRDAVEPSIAVGAGGGSQPNSAISIHSSESANSIALPSSKPSPYQSLVSKLNNQNLMQRIHETSPWRNSLLWPAHIVPTKHPRKNIMRCPQAPDNPYLTQAHFVAPRADMNFRRPNVGCRRHSKKGKYEADDPRLAAQGVNFTIPHFPDIVDVRMFPKPWMFLGSKDSYYERSGGRELGIRLARYALQGYIDPLSDNPSPHDPQLTAEVRKLELAAGSNVIAASGAESSIISPKRLGPSSSTSSATNDDSSDVVVAVSAPPARVATGLVSQIHPHDKSCTQDAPAIEGSITQRAVSKIRHLQPRDCGGVAK